MTREASIYNGEKIVSSINGAGKIGQLHVKECNQGGRHAQAMKTGLGFSVLGSFWIDGFFNSRL